MQHIPIAIIGGGTAGLNIAAQLVLKNCRREAIRKDDIKIFDPSNMHFYQSAWTMVAAGFYDLNKTFKPMDRVLPVERINSAIKLIKPQSQQLVTNENITYSYDQLVIACGVQLEWNQIKGAYEALEDPYQNVTSVYWHKYATKLNKLSKIKGTILFTEPQMPIKCPAAPQKVAYLIADKQIRENIHSEFHLHKTIGVLFGLPKYNQELMRIVNEKGIKLHLKSKLVEIRKQTAIFENQDTKEITEQYFDLLHLVPPQKAPSFIKDSNLGDNTGFVDVDAGTLQHKQYQNIWSLGDCSNLPTSKTAAGVMDQAPILVENLLNYHLNKSMPIKQYDGYTSCPILVSDKKVLLCEFKYNGIIDETFSKWVQKSESRLMFWMKRWVFPWVYWNLMAKGLWRGHKQYKFK